MTGKEAPKEVRKYLQQSHDRIFENNKKWAEEMKAKKPEFFSDLSAGQAPEYLWIGEFCSVNERFGVGMEAYHHLTEYMLTKLS